MRCLSFATFAFLGLLAKTCLAGDIMIESLSVNASVSPASKTAMATLALMNHGAAADTLIAIATPAAANAEIHQSTDENGVAKMRPVEQLEIPAGQTLDMTQLHMHIMLSGMAAPLHKDDRVTFTLTFQHAGKLVAEALVGEAAAMDHSSTP